MKNTVLKFKKERIGETRVSDYFSKDVYLANIKERFPELKSFFKIGTIDDNYTIEALTNHVYSNPNLWDFIMLLNDRDPLFDMPYDYDILAGFAESKLDEFMRQHPRINITDKRKQELYAEFLLEVIAENERNRSIEAFDPKHLSAIITTLRQEGVI